ncbi:hypothetical protein [Dyella subtropica]|uniref:hypothetical protein n=1 Tax=Dyella subtropica TaxID=2992127 RepID=UPI002256F1D2|nr:hypothetical protein [Dyella subtropica]
MEQIIECIIAGGPQDGQFRRQLLDTQYNAPLVLASEDGQVCMAAARRPDGHQGTRLVLLHPQATGQQFIAALDVLDARSAQDHTSQDISNNAMPCSDQCENSMIYTRKNG